MGKQKESKKFEEMSEFEKKELSDKHKKYYIDCLYYIIKDKKQMAHELRFKKNASRILLREAEKYQEELNVLIGFTTKESEFANMSKEILLLQNALVNKQILLVALKGKKNEVQKVIDEVREIEIKIERQKQIEGTEKELAETPF